MSIQLYSSPMKYKDPNTGNYTNIIGISGNPGRGISSVELNNDYTLTIVFDDNTSVTTTSIRGNGIENIEKTSTSGLIDTYTITDSDGGTYTFTVSNGMVPNLTIGTVVEGASAAATITGTSENPVLNLVLPKADTPVQDVQVNGTSVLQDGVANVPMGGANTFGVAKGYGIRGIGNDNNGNIYIIPASGTDLRTGGGPYNPVTSSSIHSAAFYGLAKAAGADMKDIANTTVGTYPDAQKEAIQSMLGITQMLAPTNPNLVASQPYAIGDVFAANGHLYKATAAIAQDGAIIPDTNCVETTMVDAGGKIKDVQVAGTSVVGSDGVANIPKANSSTFGVVKTDSTYGIGKTGAGALTIVNASQAEIKGGAIMYRALTPIGQHESVFYGLTKAAGVDMASSANAVGTYTEEAKAAIKSMLGVQDGLKVVRLI